MFQQETNTLSHNPRPNPMKNLFILAALCGALGLILILSGSTGYLGWRLMAAERRNEMLVRVVFDLAEDVRDREALAAENAELVQAYHDQEGVHALEMSRKEIELRSCERKLSEQSHSGPAPEAEPDFAALQAALFESGVLAPLPRTLH